MKTRQEAELLANRAAEDLLYLGLGTLDHQYRSSTREYVLSWGEEGIPGTDSTAYWGILDVLGRHHQADEWAPGHMTWRTTGE